MIRKIMGNKRPRLLNAIAVACIPLVFIFLIYVFFIKHPPTREFEIISQRFSCEPSGCAFALTVRKQQPRHAYGLVRINAYAKAKYNIQGFRNSWGKFVGSELISFQVKESSAPFVIEGSVSTLIPADHLTFWLGTVSRESIENE